MPLHVAGNRGGFADFMNHKAMDLGSPWWPAAGQAIASIFICVIVWVKLHEEPGSPKRLWRSSVTVIALIAGVSIPLWTAFSTQKKNAGDNAARAALRSQLADATRLARTAATQRGKPLDLSAATQNRLAAAIAAEPIPIGIVEVLCLPGGEANERVCDELGAVLGRDHWTASVVANATVWDGGGSGGIRVLSLRSNAKTADALAAAMRLEGLDAKSELTDPSDKRPMAIIVNHP